MNTIKIVPIETEGVVHLEIEYVDGSPEDIIDTIACIDISMKEIKHVLRSRLGWKNGYTDRPINEVQSILWNYVATATMEALMSATSRNNDSIIDHKGTMYAIETRTKTVPITASMPVISASVIDIHEIGSECHYPCKDDKSFM